MGRESEKTYVIAGGGTGGHLYPGIAIAEEIRRRRPEARVLFAGRGLPLEKSIVERHGYSLLPVRSGGVVGKSIGRRLSGAFLALRGFFEAMRELGRLRPKVVVGVGGYASFPMVLAAAARGIPTLVQEQNAVPGLANRVLGRFAAEIALAHVETRRFFGGRGQVTGTPIRAEFGTVPRTGGGSGRLLVFGGSQGARALNNAVLEALPHLEEERPRMRIVHGTGPSDEERVRRAYAERGFQAEVLPYITDIRSAYAAADLVIARAGASTCSELAACGKAAILIPLPTAAHDHQTRNAESVARAGAAVLLAEKNLSGAALADAIRGLLRDPARLEAMGRAALGLARPDAAARIVDLVERIAP